MKVVFTRCTSPHYFRGTQCPFDGWFHEARQTLAAALDACATSGTEPTIAVLGSLGVDNDLLGRVIVVEFGDAATVFEAIAAEAFWIKGNLVGAYDRDPEFI